MSYEEQAKIYYSNDDPKLLHKAISAGKLIDNRLKCKYTKGGVTNCFFDVSNYLKYFSYEALGQERITNYLIHQRKTKQLNTDILESLK